MNITQKEINLLKQVERFVDKNPSMFEYDEHTSNDFGNVMMCAVEALEKQMLKKPKRIKSVLNMTVCDCKKSLDWAYNYCPNCGQRLDWK